MSYDKPELYWSNEDGWVDKASATIFDIWDVESSRLPFGGYWAKDTGHNTQNTNAQCNEYGVRGTRCVYRYGHYNDCKFY